MWALLCTTTDIKSLTIQSHNGAMTMIWAKDNPKSRQNYESEYLWSYKTKTRKNHHTDLFSDSLKSDFLSTHLELT